MVAFNLLKYKYEKGKRIIILILVVLSFLGLVADIVNYIKLYDYYQMGLQFFTLAVILVSLSLVFLKNQKLYTYAYALTSYGLVVNLLISQTLLRIVSTDIFPNMESVLYRDLIFMLFFMTLSGFLISRIHLLVQGAMLMTTILFNVIVLQNQFMILNIPIFMIGMVGYIFILQYIVDSTDGFLNGLEESFQRVTDYKIAAENKNAAMASYQNNLIELIRSDMLTKQSMEDIYEIICKSAAKNLQINRVSVWLLSDDKSKLIRKYLYENGSEEKTQPVELESDKYPNYFEALLNKPYIKATNAFENKETSDFTESYLKPLQIYSMLDCPIIIDGKTVGVICCENKFMQKKWQTEDILYTQSLSDYIAIAFKNEQIKNLINQIKIQNAELLSKNSEIESMNSELCTLNEELRSTNDMLEETVRARTLALETQNKQLMEYAFINSHLLRAPLSRILGISNLIITEIKQIETMELLEALVNSTKELDGIVRKISLLLQDGNNLTREDIETILHKNNLN